MTRTLNMFSLVTCGLLALSARAGDMPQPPATFDTTYAAPSGSVISVAAGGNLQAALNQAQPGSIISLAAGATFTGPFTLPNKSGSGWIYVQSSAYSALPAPGTRVGPADAANMPKLVAPASANAITSANGSHHFRFVGIEFTNAPSTYTYNLVALDNGDTSVATLTNHITFDRCYFLADSTATGVRRGLLGNAAYLAVVDSDLEGFREVGADSQAIMVYNSSGPIKIVDNYLEAAGENTLFGGADSASAALVPSDIQIAGNTFFKPLSLMNGPYVVKNLLEFKAASRAIVTGNILQNNWAAGQNGFSLLITPRNQDNTAPWTIVQDLTITNNLMTNLGSGINILGSDNINVSLPTTRILIRNNVISVNGLNGASGWVFEITGNPSNLTIDHNTAFDTNMFIYAEALPLATNFTFTNNIVQRGTYGLMGTGTGDGNQTLTTFFTNPVVTANAIIGDQASNYPNGNFFPATPQAVQFVNYAGGNFALASSSTYKGKGTDGLDLGADVSLVPSLSQSGTLQPTAPSNIQVR